MKAVARAENPVYAYSLRMRYWYDPAPWRRVVRVLGGVTYGMLMLTMLAWLLVTMEVYERLTVVATGGLLLAYLFVPMLMAPQFAGDRERQTWDEIVLTPLTPREVVWGKFRSGLFWSGLVCVSWMVFIPLAFLLPFGSRAMTVDIGGVLSGLAVALVVAATAWALAAGSLLASLLARRTLQALVNIWSVAALVVLTSGILAGINWVFTGFGRMATDAPSSVVLAAGLVNPFVLVHSLGLPGIGQLVEARYLSLFGLYAVGVLAGYLVLHLLIGWGCLALAIRRFRAFDHRVREGA